MKKPKNMLLFGFISLFLSSLVLVAIPTGSVMHTASVTAGGTTDLKASSIISPVNLGTAGNFAILAQSGISTTGTTSIVGNIGVSPIASTAITGFGLIMDASNQFATSSLVTGRVYATDFSAPTPAVMTTAISDMQAAYTNAAGRTLPDYTELGAGNIGGLTLAPGLYKWSSAVSIPTALTLSGNSTAVWIFQIAQTLVISSATQVILSGGAQAKNIFWQVAGQTTLGTTSVFNGNILCATAIVMNAGATLNGRALAQTAVTLIANTINVPIDIIPPTVSSTIPANAATGVVVNSAMAATFSEAMNPSTINTTTFTLYQGLTPISGAVTYAGVTAVFTPTSSLAASTTYTATITTGAKDLAGNALAINKSWTFTTGAAPDTTAPTVSSTIPAHTATGVAVNIALAATFSEAMDPLTITTATFTLTAGVFPESGVATYVGVTATFTPANLLAASTTYTAMITIGAKDLAGNALAVNKVWTFTTGTAPDIIAPSVSATIPANVATNVLANSAMAATFSEAMDPLTITTTTFTLKQGTTTVLGTVTYAGVTAVFTPASILAASTGYTATITTGAKDLAGNALTGNKVWSFTTGSAQRMPVNLGSASNFAILTQSGISTTGTTSIVGNIGVSPIASTAITGFGLIMDASNQFATSSLVTGKVYAADYAVPTPAVMTTAISDMQAAYTDAAGRTLPDYTELGAGSIGGLTLAPGLYKWSSGVTIPTDVILSGSPTDVWIFQIAQTLVVSSAAQVILSGGAQAKNIFWQVAGQTTLGTTSVFNGNILCATAIVMTTGAALNGRALAQTAVTLIANTITVPTDTTAPTVSSTIPANAATGVAVNSAMAATFSEAMNPLTITTATFTLTRAGTPVAGTVTYVGVTATFKPANSLAASTTYIATITTGAKDLTGNALAASKAWFFTTGAAPDTTAPTVSSTIPANAATGVVVNSAMAAIFSEAMDPLTITTATFTLTRAGTLISGAVVYAGVTAVFTPTNSLEASTTYTANITTGAKDLAGNALAVNKVWFFTTGAAPDTIAPTVISTIPASATTGVVVNSAMAATFKEAMDPLTITTATFTLMQGVMPVTGSVIYAGVTAVFTPSLNLVTSTTYTATITTGAKDLAGNALVVNKVWTFTTGAAPDTTAPIVSSTIPADIAAGVAVNSAMVATFSEAMDPLTITTITFTVKQGGTPVTGTVTYAGLTAVFTPSSLAASTTYTATITTGAKDLAGNALAVNKVWTFTTGTAPQVPVYLGSAANFAILAKSGISTTGTTSIVGNIGVSPIASTAITGFGLIMDTSNQFATSSLVTGKVYAADYAVPTPAVMTTAISDMELAYADAAGRTSPDYTELGAGSIGGLTLTPGLYKWSSVVSIPTDVTLSGSADGVWIFQIAQDLVVSSAAKVILSGGTLAKNIFWQVAGQTTIGTTAVFNGNILCATAIVMNTGATLNGRALSQTAVTLDAIAISVPQETQAGPEPTTEFPLLWVVLIVVGVAGLLGAILIVRARKPSRK